ncbi:MAG: recombinase family protein [Pirellulales bacterium]
MNRKASSKPGVPTMRCAVYTRKSTEEGLDQDYNSLDAQRDAAEAYIASQVHEGWVCLPGRYDDGGFTGGNMDRPALRQLVADIEAQKVDCVVVYKVDRLSRSLLDFARIMEVFDRHKVAFVSVTQQFNTATSMGRLVLNVLLSFAQFEREIIGERIRDKIAAQKRKGKWTGGTPVLGYDVDRSGPSPRLVVNGAEAARVREIFQLYLRLGSLLPVVQDLARRGWTNKTWTTKAGVAKGGQPFDRGSLYALLTNPIYIGRLQHKKNLFIGEHDSIVTEAVFQQVAELMRKNRREGGSTARNRYGALLRKILYCKSCGHTMVHNFTGRNGRHYRYYTCTTAIKSGRKSCPGSSLPAQPVEQAVVDRIRVIAEDPELTVEVVRQAQTLADSELIELRTELGALERELGRCEKALRQIAKGGPGDENAVARTADLNEASARAERRLADLREAIQERQREQCSEDEYANAFREFDGMWNALSPRERAQTISLLVERVEYDATDQSIEITFHPNAIQRLTEGQCQGVA